jgi:CRP-like cAMP-binding protein
LCPFVRRRRRAGELLYLQGDPANRLWFVRCGSVALFRGAGEHRGEGTLRGVRRAGSLVGVEVLIQGRFADSARVAEDAVLCGAGREEIDAWLGPGEGPTKVLLALAVRSALEDPLRRAAPDGRAVERVAAWLCHDGAGAGLERRLVADLLGMRPETLSRALRALAVAGAVEVTRRRVRIVDRIALERHARGAPH